MNQHFLPEPEPRTDETPPRYRTCPVYRKAKDMVGYIRLYYVPWSPIDRDYRPDTSGRYR